MLSVWGMVGVEVRGLTALVLPPLFQPGSGEEGPQGWSGHSSTKEGRKHEDDGGWLPAVSGQGP